MSWENDGYPGAWFTHPNGTKLAVGTRQLPDPNEMGWKDTVRANPGEVTRIIARFDPFTGIYPWHCHVLEHEDHDMMRPYEVVLGEISPREIQR